MNNEANHCLGQKCTQEAIVSKERCPSSFPFFSVYKITSARASIFRTIVSVTAHFFHFYFALPQNFRVERFNSDTPMCAWGVRFSFFRMFSFQIQSIDFLLFSGSAFEALQFTTAIVMFTMTCCFFARSWLEQD